MPGIHRILSSPLLAAKRTLSLALSGTFKSVKSLVTFFEPDAPAFPKTRDFGSANELSSTSLPSCADSIGQNHEKLLYSKSPLFSNKYI